MPTLLAQLAIIAGMSFVSVGAVYNYVPTDWFNFPSFGGDPVGATVTTILGTDTLKASRSVINTNFSNLNTDKLESGDYGATLNIGTLTTDQLVATSTTASSTFAFGIKVSTGALDVDSTTATSTFGNGLKIEGGCVEYLGSCLTNAVTDVSNADSSLTISPTTGNVVASLNVGNSNTWTGTQLFGYTATTSFSGGLYGSLVSAPLFHATSSTATSTFSGGIKVADFEVTTACIGCGDTFLVLANVAGATSTANQLGVANTEDTTTSDSYVEAKEIIMRADGTITAEFECKEDSGGDGNARIYINDTAEGTEQSCTTSYTHFSQTITVGIGDRVQLYHHRTGAGTNFVKDFRVYGSQTESTELTNVTNS